MQSLSGFFSRGSDGRSWRGDTGIHGGAPNRLGLETESKNFLGEKRPSKGMIERRYRIREKIESPKPLFDRNFCTSYLFLGLILRKVSGD